MTMSKKRKADALPSESNPSKLGKSDKSASQVDDVKRRPAGRLDKVRSAMPQGLNLSRKDLRKEMRQLKKSRRNAYSQKSKMPTMASKLTEKHDELIAKKEAARKVAEKLEKKKKDNARKKRGREERKKAYDKAEKERVEQEEERRRVEYEEEREIKTLEKQLHMNKRKTKALPKAFIADGLDYILDCIDPEKSETVKEQEKNDVWVSELDLGEDGEQSDQEQSDQEEVVVGGSEDELSDDDEDDLSEDEEDEEGEEDMTDGDTSSEADKDSIEDEEEDESGEVGEELSDYGGLESDENLQPDSDQEELEENESDEMGSEEDDDDDLSSEDVSDTAEVDDGGESDGDGSDDDGDDNGDQDALKEDIYGRLRDSKGNVVTSGAAYVPPARRRQLDGLGDEARKQRMMRLKKQLKGQLNRLSDSNMVSICNQIEALYREQSRADMNDCLRELVIEMSMSDILTPERLSMELAMLVALLHNNIGTEIGATFLECLAETFRSLHADHSANEIESKKIDNVAAFLCHLYSFQVTHSVLITDIIYTLIQSFKDKDVELILLMLKNVGFTLRKDDPTSLRDIILQTQKKANDVSVDSFKDKSRVKFMLEILLAIKNNNMRKIPNYDTSHMDHLKKLLKGYIKGGSLQGGQLRITYKDLLEAQSKGKWWVVGSAWQGSQADSHSLTGSAVTKVSRTSSHSSERPEGDKFSKSLLELARKQRMNTENRRLIFCTIMSAEDYVDAFEKLLKLGLKTQQEREIITVILECCSNESSYNAYYTHLMSKFITYHRRFLFTLQTTMWDRFKMMTNLSDSCINNLASLSGQLIVDETLPLSLLKNIEFGELNKSLVKFLKTLINRIFKADKKLIANIFYKIGAGGSKLRHMKEGLELFMHHFMLRKCKDNEKPRMELCVSAAENALNQNMDAVAF